MQQRFRFLMVAAAVRLQQANAFSATTAKAAVPNSPTRSLRRTSFVKQQSEGLPNDIDRFKQSQLTLPEDLLRLAHKNRNRTPGSYKYNRTWRHWSQLAVDSIRYYMSQNLPYPVDREAFEALWFQLGVAADRGEMPSFENAGSRSGYALDFFCRARLLSDLLMMCGDNPSFPEHWLNTMAEKRLLDGSYETPTSCKMTSLGGGPGFDFVAAALVATYTSSASGTSLIDATVLDYEEGWKDLVAAMNTATQLALQQPGMTAKWGGKCDITQPLSHPHNRAVLDVIHSTDIWTCQYCVSENAISLRDSNYVFFRELFEQVPEGTLFLFTETTTRLWAPFFELIANECNYMEIGFPSNVRRSKKGRQLSLCKRGEPVEPRQSEVDSYEEFQDMVKCHDRKLEIGIVRQTKKVKGAKK